MLLIAGFAFAQGPQKIYAWAPQDTLEIAFKEVLTNDGYKAQKLVWTKKRVIGTALMVTFGAVAYYYHQQAEDSYSKYLRAGSFSQLNKHFTETEKFDRLKGAAGIGIEIGFLLNVWSFL